MTFFIEMKEFIDKTNQFYKFTRLCTKMAKYLLVLKHAKFVGLIIQTNSESAIVHKFAYTTLTLMTHRQRKKVKKTFSCLLSCSFYI